MFKVFKEDHLGKWLKNDETKEVFMLNKEELKMNDESLRSLLLTECEFTEIEANQILQAVRNRRNKKGRF